MKFDSWKSEREGTTIWGWRLQGKRVQFSLTVYRHTYATVSDRWVFSPGFVYDRKKK